MLIIHPVRKGGYVLLREEEYLKLIRNVRQIQEIEIVEKESEIFETEEERLAYAGAMAELESGDTISFDDVKSAWLYQVAYEHPLTPLKGGIPANPPLRGAGGCFGCFAATEIKENFNCDLVLQGKSSDV